MLFFQRRLERRTHRSDIAFAAHARAVAHLDRLSEAALFRKVELRLDMDRLVVGAVAQVFGQFRSVDDLAWVQNVLRIPQVLEFEQAAINLVAEEPAVVFRARDTVAVLAAHRSAMLHHKLEDLVSNLGHLGDLRRIFQIDHRAYVQAADRCVAVVAALGVVLVEYAREATQERWQFFQRYCGVFYESDRLVIPPYAHHDAE